MEQILNQKRSEDTEQKQGCLIILCINVFGITQVDNPRLKKTL